MGLHSLGSSCTSLGFLKIPRFWILEVPDFKFLIDNSRATSNHAHCRCVPKIKENDINQIQLIWALFPSAYFWHIRYFLAYRSWLGVGQLCDPTDFLMSKTFWFSNITHVSCYMCNLPRLRYKICTTMSSFMTRASITLMEDGLVRNY